MSEKNGKMVQEKIYVTKQHYEKICVLHKVKSKFRSTTQAMEILRKKPGHKSYQEYNKRGKLTMWVNRRIFTISSE